MFFVLDGLILMLIRVMLLLLVVIRWQVGIWQWCQIILVMMVLVLFLFILCLMIMLFGRIMCMKCGFLCRWVRLRWMNWLMQWWQLVSRIYGCMWCQLLLVQCIRWCREKFICVVLNSVSGNWLVCFYLQRLLVMLLEVVDRLVLGNICVSLVVVILELVSLLFCLIMQGQGMFCWFGLICICMVKLFISGCNCFSRYLWKVLGWVMVMLYLFGIWILVQVWVVDGILFWQWQLMCSCGQWKFCCLVLFGLMCFLMQCLSVWFSVVVVWWCSLVRWLMVFLVVWVMMNLLLELIFMVGFLLVCMENILFVLIGKYSVFFLLFYLVSVIIVMVMVVLLNRCC